MRLVNTVDLSHQQHSWFAFAPSRLGYYDAVDNAADALSLAREYYSGPCKNESTIKASFQAYGKAVKSLRRLLASTEDRLSDQTLLAIALLSFYEVLVTRSLKAFYTHWSGVSALLQRRQPTNKPSELARALLYAAADRTFHTPCASGTPSPFDNERWLSWEPASQVASSGEVVSLTKFNYQHFVRLPRLIAHVRDLRSGDLTQLAAASGIANDLLQLNEDDCENGLLHRVKVVKTTDLRNRTIVPFSLQFQSLEDMSAAVTYWSARLMVFRLALIIIALVDLSKPDLDIEGIEASQARMATNIMMSMQYASTHGVFGEETMNPAFASVWGAVNGRATLRNIPAEEVKEWLLRKWQHALSRWVEGGTSTDMDGASELLDGGPLTGFLTNIYTFDSFHVCEGWD